MNRPTIHRILLVVIASLNTYAVLGQCATSGTITTDCTTTGNLTITGTLTVSSGVDVEVTGTLSVRAGGTLNGTGATFDLGDMSTTYGSVNEINGGTYNIGSFSGGSDTDITDATITATGSFSSGYGEFNYTNSTINIAGAFTVGSDVNNVNNSTINSGTGNAGTNDATALSMNGGGTLNLTNGSQMNVRGSVTNNVWNIDDSDVVVTGDFDNAGDEILTVTNGGSFSVGGNFNNHSGDVTADDDGSVSVSGDFTNTGGGSVSADTDGTIQVDGDYDNTDGSTDVDGGTVSIGGDYDGDAPTGDAGDCDTGGGGCCGSGCSVLPVSLLSFSGSFENGRIMLNWRTATELNNDFFTLEKSFDGENFTTLGTIRGSGTINDPRSYSFSDYQVRGHQFYRLSQTDYDGTYELLKTILIADHLQEKVVLYPNPVKAGKPVKVYGFIGEASWSLYSVFGEVLQSGERADFIEISTTRLSPGYYVLRTSFDGRSRSKVLVVD